MSNVLALVHRLFRTIFVNGNSVGFLKYIINFIVSPRHTYLLIGIILVIIGFSAGLIKRLIHG